MATPMEFMRGFGRRVKAQIRNDATAVPIVRSVWFKWTAEHTNSMLTPYTGKRGQPQSAVANELIEAAKALQHHLWHGFTGTGKIKMPIAGDTTRLPYAVGLTPIQRRLAWNMHFLCHNLPGVQQLRLTMGHAQFGARVTYGDCLFFTISPNEQHSSLVLRVSRYRQNDPFIQGEEPVQKSIRRTASKDMPKLSATGAVQRGVDDANVEGPIVCSHRSADEQLEIDLPDYEFRRIGASRDPLAVIDAYAVNVRLRLARVLGVRMCPRCPRCNDDDSKSPCQDKFGSNMMPMGGSIGGVPALGAATEHQTHGTPHLHGEAHVACIYQYGTLQEIAERIKEKLFDPTSVMDFHAWLHREEPLDTEQHDAELERVEDAWRQRFAAREHDAMSQTPAYVADDRTPTMWSATPVSREGALADGRRYKRTYFKDVQFIFSRVQHHFHKKTKKGYVPLPRTCVSARSGGKCKHDFPMEKQLNVRMRVTPLRR